MRHLFAITVSVLAITGASSAWASAETDLLKAQIKALERRIDELEKKEKSAPAPVASKLSPQPQIEQRLAVVERNQEIAKEDAQAKAQVTPKFQVDEKGFTVSSADKQYSMTFGAYVQADNRTFFDNGGQSGLTSQFLARSMRPIISAKMTDYFDARFMMDFGRGNSTLLDAYGNFHPMPGNDLINFRLGEFKSTVGIERLQAEQELLFVERGQTTNLVPFRDIGFMAYGQLIPDQLEYQVGVTNGASDLQVNTGDNDNRKDVIGRIYSRPLRWAGVYALQGLGVGLGGTYGTHQGNTTTPGLTAGYQSTGQRTYFTYRNAAGNIAYANGTQWRLNPQAMYYYGPFGTFGEYVIDSQDVRVNSRSRNLRNTGWLAIAGYVLTGEDASFEGVRPKDNFSPSQGHWGAFEVVGRMSRLQVDSDAFPLFADPNVSSRGAHEATVGLNWYFNPAVKLNLDYETTWYDGGAAGGQDRKTEKGVLTRAQLKF